MLRILTNSAILAAAFGITGFAFFQYQKISGDDERYNLFDFLQRKKATPAVVDSKTRQQIVAQAEPKKKLDLNNLELLERVNQSLSDLTDSVVPSVVSIDTKKRTERLVPIDPLGFFGYQRSDVETPGLGSGVIVSAEGHVITNHHVVAGVDSIQVTAHDGTIYPAEWVGSDPGVDIAVLKILPPDENEKLPNFIPLTFGDSDKVRVGEMVLAVGNPFGLNETVTRGIVSAKQRRLSDQSNEYFQVDAVINPGNSGGPLINIHGEIIGVNVAIFTGQANVQVWQGIGLAIPSNEAQEIYNAVVLNEPLIRGYLGLELSNISPRLAQSLDFKSQRGAIVVKVAKNSPAEKAGLLPGDIVLKFDEKDANSAEETLRSIRKKKAGDEVNLVAWRKGTPKPIIATIAERPDTSSITLRSDITENGQSIAESLGVSVRDLTAQERQILKIGDTPAIIIESVKKGSPAAVRFAEGDLIHLINRDRVTNVAEFYDLLGSLPQNRASVMILSRNGRQIRAVLSP